MPNPVNISASPVLPTELTAQPPIINATPKITKQIGIAIPEITQENSSWDFSLFLSDILFSFVVLRENGVFVSCCVVIS